MLDVLDTSRKGLRSLIILVCWKIWKERNARVFECMESTNFVVLQKIKDDVGLWILAGAKHLSISVPPPPSHFLIGLFMEVFSSSCGHCRVFGCVIVGVQCQFG